MAQSLDQAAAKRYAPNGMKDIIENISEHNFKTFLASDTWNRNKTTRWVISTTLDDVNALSKVYGINKKTVSHKKVVDVDIDGWKLRFKESQKKSGGRAPDAKTTAMQEKGSAFIFSVALKRNIPWATEHHLATDEGVMKGLRKLYPDVDDDWISNYWKQHKTILHEFGNGGARKFDHSGSGSFMEFIAGVVKKNFGVSKKDNWNPADIWMIKGSKDAMISKVEETVYGSKDSQTIQQLNALLRGLFKDRKVVGISLKKISGKEAKWEEYNVDKLTLEEIDEYKYKDIDLECNLSSNMTQDTKVQLRGSTGNKGFNFQIKANTSTEFSGLKWESTPVGAAAARGGKAQVDAVIALLRDNKQAFEKASKEYPQSLGTFQEKERSYKLMFTRVNKKVETKCNNSAEFATNISNLFLSKPHVANTKLMQLTFLDQLLKITNSEKYTEFWTDMVFLSIKKGDRFGPFGKLY